MLEYKEGNIVKLSHKNTPTGYITFELPIDSITEYEVLFLDGNVIYYFDKGNITFSPEGGIWVKKSILRV